MPQKKNPDAAELLRAKAPRVVGHLAALHGVLHALPLTYNKDLQEDKEHLFDAADTLELRCARRAGMVARRAFDRERMAAAASDELIAATDLADLLVRRGMPFREAHGVVAGLVRAAVDAAGRCPAPTRSPIARSSARRREVLAERSWLESKVREGGTALASACASSSRPRARAARGADAVLPLGDFYDRPVVDVARDLVGCTVPPRRRAAASSSRPRPTTGPSRPATPTSGVTPRTATLFGPPGTRLRLPLLRRSTRC